MRDLYKLKENKCPDCGAGINLTTETAECWRCNFKIPIFQYWQIRGENYYG